MSFMHCVSLVETLVKFSKQDGIDYAATSCDKFVVAFSLFSLLVIQFLFSVIAASIIVHAFHL